MALGLEDRSFRLNVVSILVVALLLAMSLSSGTISPVGHNHQISSEEMMIIQGKGWGSSLLVTGLVIAGVGLALVATGGTIAIAGAFAYSGTAMGVVVGGGMGALNAGFVAGSIGTGVAAYGEYIR